MPVSAVLLAAGYATRLYPLTNDVPKALLPLGPGSESWTAAAGLAPRVILDEVCRSLTTVPGLRQSFLVTNHRFAAQFQEWQRSRQADIEVLDDGTETAETRLGAIRDLELARRRAAPENDVLVVGTDNLFRWPLSEFVARAQRHGPDPSVALWTAPSHSAATQFGVVTQDARDRITALTEKSPQPPSRDVALCVYYFPAAMCGKIQEFLDEVTTADAPGYFIQWLAKRGAVYGIMMPGPWYDIGTLEAYHEVISAWNC